MVATVVTFVGLGAVTMVGAHADTGRPEPRLCESNADVVTRFPYVMYLDDSDAYPNGPRSCSYEGKRRIVYQCNGDRDAPATYLHVIDHSLEERRVIRASCDDQRHLADTVVAYGDSSGPYHIHWHIPDFGGWDSAYLEIS